tara:strand:- start:78 stop:467 length:390 start_codon:yes stop_codon:yes gene_type:complete
MQSYSFTFSTNLNISLQVGDVAYYVVTTNVAGENGGDSFNTASQESIIRIGVITAINQNTKTITCSTEDDFYIPTSPFPYIFFGKDNRVNTGSIVGYYASVKFRNTSTEKGDKKGEMFAASCEVYESSK